MNKICFVIAATLFLFSIPVLSEITEEKTITLNNKHHLGARIGTWINNGETPPEIAFSIDSTAQIFTDINDVNFFIEGYFAYNIFSSAFIEFSLGLVNRGAVTVVETQGTDTTRDIGNLMVYPMLVTFKYYPMGSMSSKIQPYFSLGGGLYYGRRDIQITSNYYNAYYGNNGDSETDFNYTLSGGFNWLLNNSLALDFNVKYMPVNFSTSLVSIKDYKATSITVGIIYMRNK